MDTSIVTGLVKAKLGINGTVRDTYISAIVNGVITELEDEKGLVLDGANPYHLIFVVDYVTWRYQNRDGDKGMPRHLQYRLHNLIIHVGIKNLIVSDVLIVGILPLLPAENTVYILQDSSKQMYIDGAWTAVDMVNGIWTVVIA